MQKSPVQGARLYFDTDDSGVITPEERTAQDAQFPEGFISDENGRVNNIPGIFYGKRFVAVLDGAIDGETGEALNLQQGTEYTSIPNANGDHTLASPITDLIAEDGRAPEEVVAELINEQDVDNEEVARVLEAFLTPGSYLGGDDSVEGFSLYLASQNDPQTSAVQSQAEAILVDDTTDPNRDTLIVVNADTDSNTPDVIDLPDKTIGTNDSYIATIQIVSHAGDAQYRIVEDDGSGGYTPVVGGDFSVDARGVISVAEGATLSTGTATLYVEVSNDNSAHTKYVKIDITIQPAVSLSHANGAGSVAENDAGATVVEGIETSGAVTASDFTISDGLGLASGVSYAGMFEMEAATGAPNTWNLKLTDTAELDFEAIPGGVINLRVHVQPSNNAPSNILEIAVTVTDDTSDIAFSGVVRGEVTKDSDNYEVSGAITIANRDGATVTPTAGTYGTLAFDSDSGTWTYTLNNADATVQSLLEGQLLIDIAELSVGGVTQSISINIMGANEDVRFEDGNGARVSDANVPTNIEIGTTAALNGSFALGNIFTNLGISLEGQLPTSQDLSVEFADSVSANLRGLFSLDASGDLAFTGTNANALELGVSTIRLNLLVNAPEDTTEQIPLNLQVNIVNDDDDGRAEYEITGDVEANQTLTVSRVQGTAEDPDGVVGAVVFQWFRGDEGTSNFALLGTGSTYSVTQADIDSGDTIGVFVRYTDGSGTTYTNTDGVDATTIAVFASPISFTSPAAGAARTINLDEDTMISSSTAHFTVQARSEDDAGAMVDIAKYELLDENRDVVSEYKGFQIDPDSGDITLRSSLDYESDDTTITLRVLATDMNSPAETATLTLTVNVQDVNDNSPIFVTNAEDPTLTDGTEEIFESAGRGTVVARVRAVDADGSAENNTVGYDITNGDANDVFRIDGNGVITVNAPLDYDTTPSYTLTITASDGESGSIDAMQMVTITLTDVNDIVPDVTPPIDATGRVRTTGTDDASGNAAASTGYSITIIDMDTNNDFTFGVSDPRFDFVRQQNSNVWDLVLLAGQAVTEDVGTTTSPNTITLTYYVDDGANRVPGGTVTLTVIDTPVNFMTPTIRTINLPEDTGATTTPHFTVEATSSDESGPVDIDTYMLLDDTDTATTDYRGFTINSSTGAITLTGSLDFEDTHRDGSTITLRVVATDDNQETGQITLTVNLSDVNEHAPVFVTNAEDSDLSTGTDEIAENAANGDRVGLFRATDADGTNNDVTYTLDDGGVGLFGIRAVTGTDNWEIYVLDASMLDYDSGARSYTIAITASDSDPDTTTRMSSGAEAFTIHLTDINDVAPTINIGASTAAGTLADEATADTDTGIRVVITDDARDEYQFTYKNFFSFADITGFELRQVSGATYGLYTTAEFDFDGFDEAIKQGGELPMLIGVRDTLVDGSTPPESVIPVRITLTDINDNAPEVAVTITDDDYGVRIAYTDGFDNKDNVIEALSTPEPVVETADMGDADFWIGGDVAVGETLTIRVYEIDPDGMKNVRYGTWTRTTADETVEIQAAGFATYVVTADDVGALINVEITYTDATSNTDVTLTATHAPATSGDDIIYGSPRADVISAIAGDDTIRGGGDADKIIGGSYSTNTLLYGDAGDDVLTGGSHSDDNTLHGGADDDLLTGGSRSYNTLHGGADDDTLYGGTSSYNTLHGGADDDTLYGGTWSSDTLYGDAGDDMLYGGTRSLNTLYGGADDDDLYGGTRGENTLYGGAGTNELYGGTRSSNTLHGGAEDDTLRGGTRGDNTLYGGVGEDTLFAGTRGLNILHGGVGDDNLYGGTRGTSRLYGDAGDDYLYGGTRGTSRLYGGADDDTLYGGARGSNIFYGGAGVDTLYGGFHSANTLYGGAGADELYAGTSNENTLYGGLGNDILTAGWAATIGLFYGGDGIDIMVGGISTHYYLDMREIEGNTDIVRDFRTDNQILVYLSTADMATIDAISDATQKEQKLRELADLRFDSGVTPSALGSSTSDDTNTDNFLIYHTRGTDSDTSDDILLMVLEDFTGSLTIDAFDIRVTPDNFDPNGRDAAAEYSVTSSTEGGITTLTATLETPDPDGASNIRYQWFNVATNTDITDADSNTYELPSADTDDDYGVRITYTDGFDNKDKVVEALSTPEPVDENGDTGDVDFWIRGDVAVGETLEVVYTSDPDVVGNVRYGTWTRTTSDGVTTEIQSAGSGTYQVQADDVGALINVEVTYTNTDSGEGVTFTVTHAPVTTGDDIIHGSPRADVISALAGEDTIRGGDGADKIIGGSYSTNTLLYGDAGDDVLTGGSHGTNALYGGADNDVLTGGSRSYNTLYGGEGEDTLYGGTSSGNTLYGGADDDTLYGGTSSGNTLYGGAGEDILHGGTRSTNILYGGAEDDELYGGTRGSNTLYGEAGADTLHGGTRGLNMLHGGAGDDELYGGTRGENILYGDAGDDVLHGGTSSLNTLHGGAGDDDLYAGTSGGRHTLYGGAGTDTLHGGTSGDNVLHGGAGDDTLYGGTTADNTLYGDAGDDTLYGGFHGTNILYGGAGDDFFQPGWLGDDGLLFGGDGIDRMDGGTDIHYYLDTREIEGNTDIVHYFHANNQILVYLSTSDIATIDATSGATQKEQKLRELADLRFGSGVTPSEVGPTVWDDPSADNFLIYHTRGTDSDTSDDILLMVLEDFTGSLTIDSFDIRVAPDNFDPNGRDATAEYSVTSDTESGQTTLDANLADPDGATNIRYQWFNIATNADITGANSDSYELPGASTGMINERIASNTDAISATALTITASDADLGGGATVMESFFKVYNDDDPMTENMDFEVVDVDGTWKLQLKSGSALNYETTSTISLKIGVNDGVNGEYITPNAFTLTVNNLDEGDATYIISGNVQANAELTAELASNGADPDGVDDTVATMYRWFRKDSTDPDPTSFETADTTTFIWLQDAPSTTNTYTITGAPVAGATYGVLVRYKDSSVENTPTFVSVTKSAPAPSPAQIPDRHESQLEVEKPDDDPIAGMAPLPDADPYAG